MKKISLKASAFLMIATLLSCTSKKSESTEPIDINEMKITSYSDQVLETAIIYEANIRQYSPEGSFKEFTKDIPKLKQLGVKILWLMPIYPISHTKRKATGGVFADELPDPSARERALGSYYAVADYRKVNPEFGTLEDFRELVKVAHENGLFVVLDWVANHTGWDHIWIKQHPEWYSQDSNGNIIHPAGTDWTDTADLNYDNAEMRSQMAADMRYWLTEEDIDGFRCDMAGMVPLDFWASTIKTLRDIKPIFMLAEAWEPQLMDVGFDAAYGWETHHIMNRIAKGENSVASWDHRMHEIDSMYKPSHILMNFTSNHDENSWQGSALERLGDAAEAFAALSYTVPGLPLIYSGQEYDLNKRLLFFEKDTIPHKMGKFFNIYEKLGALKNTHPALNGGKEKASYRRVETSDPIHLLAFRRVKDGQSLIYIANLSKESKTFKANLTGSFRSYLSEKEIQIKPELDLNFAPWEYHILLEN